MGETGHGVILCNLLPTDFFALACVAVVVATAADASIAVVGTSDDVGESCFG